MTAPRNILLELMQRQENERAAHLEAAGWRSDIHAHYCPTCHAIAPCAGMAPAGGYSCLLRDACPACGTVPEGIDSYLVRP